MTCSIDECTSPVNARGWCSMHYNRWAATGTPLRFCLGCGGEVADGRTRWCSPECKPPCAFEGCRKRAYAKNGYCGGHDRQLREEGVVRAFKFERPAPGGNCEICSAKIPEGRRQKYCSGACRMRASHHRRRGSERPRSVACQGCGENVSLLERKADGRLRRSDARWCNKCLDGASRRRMYRYGVNPMQYQEALSAGCEICGSRTDLHIDHDHDCCPGGYTCGDCVRGFLCGSCNRGLGLFDNDADKLMAAAAYALKSQNVLGPVPTSGGGV